MFSQLVLVRQSKEEGPTVCHNARLTQEGTEAGTGYGPQEAAGPGGAGPDAFSTGALLPSLGVCPGELSSMPALGKLDGACEWLGLFLKCRLFWFRRAGGRPGIVCTSSSLLGGADIVRHWATPGGARLWEVEMGKGRGRPPAQVEQRPGVAGSERAPHSSVSGGYPWFSPGPPSITPGRTPDSQDRDGAGPVSQPAFPPCPVPVGSQTPLPVTEREAAFALWRKF